MDETRVDPDQVHPTQGIPTAGRLAGNVLCNRYHLERLIGAGGMAQVWEGTDAVLGRRVAIKVLHPHLADDTALVRRFRQEAVAAARLNDPGIVGVYDTCSDGGHEAIIMELLEATTLRRLLDDRGTIDADTTMRVGLRLLDALEVVHRAGLVHRDVKPSNILLCDDGRVKIADFGIAKADDQTELTRDGDMIGTASYLAPEQLGSGPVDGRADLYALGLVLYECLTGRLPFEGDNGVAVAIARLHTDPVDPRRIHSGVPVHLANAIMRALARDPDDRFHSTAEFRAALVRPDLPVAAPVPVAPSDPTRAAAAVAGGSDAPGFGRSERRWLMPAFLILLVAVAVVVAGMLLRETGSIGTPTTTTTAAPVIPLAVSATTSYDPQGSGSPGENDSLAERATDGDDTTAWRTESYDQADFFGPKHGVGLVLRLAAPARLDRLDIRGSTNGWSGQVYVLDGPPDPAGLGAATPAGSFTDVRGQVDVPLHGARGNTVVLWITDLGDPVDGGRHRVEVSEVVPFGVSEPG